MAFVLWPSFAPLRPARPLARPTAVAATAALFVAVALTAGPAASAPCETAGIAVVRFAASATSVSLQDGAPVVVRAGPRMSLRACLPGEAARSGRTLDRRPATSQFRRQHPRRAHVVAPRRAGLQRRLMSAPTV